MIIKINDFSPISHKLRLEIVEEYLNQHETSSMKKDDCCLNSLLSEYKITETGKYPDIIEVGYSRYHIKCKKTKTCWVFDIWLAV
jgi:hypothetical protein